MNMCFKGFYGEIKIFIEKKLIWKIKVDIQYKIVSKKIKPTILSLSLHCEENFKEALIQPNLIYLRKIRHELYILI